MFNLSRKARWELTELIDQEVLTAFAGGQDSPPPQNRTEALGIALSTALPSAAERSAPLMRKLGVRARLIGAFSFGAPLVGFADGFGEPRVSTLADLMIVLDDLRPSSPSRRASLARVRTPFETAEPCATLDLHARWPPFRFRNAAYSDRPRRLREGSIAGSESPHFSVVDLVPPRPIERSAAANSLGAMLAALVSGAAGRPAVRGGQDDWSLTVDELLRRTVRATLSGMAAPTFELRSATTFAGQHGTGHVIFENATGLDDEQAAAVTGQEGPLSVAHLCFD